MDTFSKEDRSRIMANIKSKDTTPESAVRSLLFSLGYRFRLHKKDLPGKPDIVMKKFGTVVFVHGCFWHHHQKCRRANWPKSNKGYWIPKIRKNVERDRSNVQMLKDSGWRVLIIWECEVKNLEKLRKRLRREIN